MKRFASLLFAAAVTLAGCGEKPAEGHKFDLGGQWLAAGSFSQGLARARDGEGWFYLDAEGKIVFRTEAAACGDFHEDRAWYRSADASGGYFDRSGRAVGAPFEQFGMAGPSDFSEGYASVTSAHAYGVDGFMIDKTGKISDRFERFRNRGEYGSFSEGIAVFTPADDDRFGFVRLDGSVLAEPVYRDASGFSCGLARVFDQTTLYLDAEGRTVFEVPVGFDEAGDFREGFARIKTDAWYYADTDGNRAFAGGYSEALDFSEGTAVVKDSRGWLAVDAAGKVVFRTDADELRSRSEGFYAFRRGKEWGYLNAEGSVAVPARYQSVGDVSEGYAAVSAGRGRWGMLVIKQK